MDRNRERGGPKRRALDLAWGRTEGRRPGPSPSLTLDEVLSATVGMADDGGLGAVSMPRVAARLGVTPMALYRYVRNKDELVSLAVDAASGDLPANAEPGEDWRECIGRWANAMLDGLERHPWVANVPMREPPLGPRQVAWMERCLECLADTGLSERDKLGVLNLLSGYVLGHFRLYNELSLAASAAGTTREAAEREYVETLLGYVDPERFPRLLTAFAAMAGDDREAHRSDFSFGLGRILDGVERMITAQRGR